MRRTYLWIGLLLILAGLSAATGTSAKELRTKGDCSPIVVDVEGDVEINVTCPTGLTPLQLQELKEALTSALTEPPAVVTQLTELSEHFGVQKSALRTFFKTLKRKNVDIDDLDYALREIAKRHLKLIAEIQAKSSDEPGVRALKDQAATAIEVGDYERAEALLLEAEQYDLSAISEIEIELANRRLSAAETRTDRGELKLVQLDYQGAAALFAQATNLVPEGHPLVVADYANRAGGAYQDAGDYRHASDYLEQALALREAALPADDTGLSTSLNNLALLYDAQGKYAEAESLYKRSRVIREKALGPDHPDVAGSLNNLAELYRTQGKYAEAEPLYKRSLAISEKALGPEHPSVATSLNNLALLYKAQGKYAEAEPLYKRSLVILEKALGPEHPHVALTLENYAALLRETRRGVEAERLEARAKAIRAKHLAQNPAK